MSRESKECKSCTCGGGQHGCGKMRRLGRGGSGGGDLMG